MKKEDNKILIKQVKDAIDLSHKIFSIVKKDWFTTAELVNKSNTGHEQAKDILNNLGRFGLLITEPRDDKYKHKIIFVPNEREELIQKQIDTLHQETKFLNHRIEYLTELKNIKISPLVKA